jgi:hypothetical protein
MLIASVWRGGARLVFVVGLLIGGAATALLGLVVGSLVVRSWLPEGRLPLLIVGAVLVLSLLHDSRILSFRIPQNARQVPEKVSRAGPRAGAFQFGVEMGTGTRTFMTSLLPHVALIAVIVAVPWPTAVLMGAAFGAGRALVPLARAVADNEDTWSSAFERRERPIQVALGSALLVAGLLIFVV